jgi:hypothetical protein
VKRQFQAAVLTMLGFAAGLLLTGPSFASGAALASALVFAAACDHRRRVRQDRDGRVIWKLDGYRKAEENAHRRELKAFLVPPQQQLEQLSRQYGLPVVTPALKSEPLPLCTTAPTEPEYVPAGQEELTASLLEYVKAQVDEATRTRWTAGRRREWHVSPEWARDTQKLLNWADRLPSDPGFRESLPGFLYGYPVVVGGEYGVPELVAS